MKNIIWAILFLITLTSCKPDNKESVTQDDLASLNSQVKETSDQLTELQSRIDKLYSLVYTLQNNEAVFTPSSKGYSTVRSNVGYFVVSLDNLTRYANGYKATFSIGNPNLITFNDAKIFIRWGEDLTKEKNFSTWYNSLKTAEIKINKPLLPGIWNKVTIVLSPATPQETGFVGLSIQSDTIYLSPDYRKNTS